MALMHGAPSADLMGIGEHCGVSHCGQLDFLPFTCDCCSRTFCLDHRSYAAHACPASGTKECEVLVCPLCARAIKVAPGQEPNAAFEAHTRSGCDPSHYNKVHNKPRCPVAGCKEKLTLTNTYRCKKCSTKICLKHRHEDQHECTSIRGQNMARAAQATQKTVFGSKATAVPKPVPTTRQPQPQPVSMAAAQNHVSNPLNRQPATSQVTYTAAQAEQRTSNNYQPQARTNPRSNANPMIPAHLPEVCPQCQARFATVARLVQHVEDFHPAASSIAAPSRMPGSSPAGGWPGARGGGGGQSAGQDQFRCPHCSAVFFNPVRLVQHQEACGTRQQQAAGGAQGSKDGCAIS